MPEKGHCFYFPIGAIFGGVVDLIIDRNWILLLPAWE